MRKDTEFLFHLVQRARAALVTAVLRPSFAAFGSHSTLLSPLRLAGSRCIEVGSGTYIGAGMWIQVGPVKDCNEVRLQIGNRVSISGYGTISAAESVVIEDDVLIAKAVYISDHTHEHRLPGPIRDQGITKPQPVLIGRGAWLGQGAVIMPGVHIGANAVVGAYSVVRDDVPAGATVVGAPARLVGIRTADGFSD